MSRILIVDDKEENLYYLRTLLSGHGHDVETARHGAEALVMARQSPPDLVISDLLMPVMDGYTLLRHWRADPHLARIPFIVFTATYTELEDERLALQLGADAFLLKPSEPEDFLERIREVQASVAASVPVPPKFPVDDEKDLLKTYSETLIRKLEEKTLELQETNRALERDMAERTRLESQLLQSQKLEAVGRLAGGVAHDFNNLLGVIMGHAELLMAEASDDQRFEIEQILEATQRAAGLTRQLLAFSRRQIVDPKALDLNVLVAEMEKMLRRLLGEDIELSISQGSGVASVRADPGQLEQVVMNLAINARDAMPLGGRLSLETSQIEVGKEAPIADAREEIAPGRYVQLEVRDTGTGIEERLLANIFEPFFTTKEPGKGTGLGLAMVYGIVKQSGGHVWVSSEVGRGTQFTICLPLIDEAPVGREARSKVRSRGGEETVLLVEDETPLLAIARRILADHGYRVLGAAGSQEALALAQDYPDEIHLLIADVVMPRMNGRALAESLVAGRPRLRVLYISGYTDDVIAHRGVLAPGTRFLAKPFTGEQLLARVREALDEPAATEDR
jgi:signal transduction histidine kinase